MRTTEGHVRGDAAHGPREHLQSRGSARVTRIPAQPLGRASAHTVKLTTPLPNHRPQHEPKLHISSLPDNFYTRPEPIHQQPVSRVIKDYSNVAFTRKIQHLNYNFLRPLSQCPKMRKVPSSEQQHRQAVLLPVNRLVHAAFTLHQQDWATAQRLRPTEPKGMSSGSCTEKAC